MRLFRLLAVTAIVMTLSALSAEEKIPPPKDPVRKTSFDVGETGSADGTVLTVTKDIIFIAKGKGLPAVYPVHDCLAAGKVHKLVRTPNSYLLEDVKVGDMVILDTVVENKQTYCVAIQIWERPGGLIPPGQVVAKEQTYHDVRNARIAFRDKGTPIPDHLIPKPPPPIVPKK